MSINAGYNELASEVDYYRMLFQLIHIHPMANGWISWRIGDHWKLEEIRLDWVDKVHTKFINPKEIAILTIAFCEWNSSSPEQRLVDQDRLMWAGIVTIDDIIVSTQSLLKNIRRDHLTNPSFLQNWVENAAKIAIAKRAYDWLAQYFSDNPERLNDPESIILLAYVIAILGYRFELRPYMINPSLVSIDWVSIYDSMFSNFSDNNKQFFIDSGYHVLWEAIKLIRDEIYNKKEAKRERIDLLARMRNGLNIGDILRQIFIQSPPSASSHRQDPLCP